MMWAATVRRCPSGHVRHPSQFGARLQLARALTHAPYLICDGIYSYPPPAHSHFDTEVGVPNQTSSRNVGSQNESSVTRTSSTHGVIRGACPRTTQTDSEQCCLDHSFSTTLPESLYIGDSRVPLGIDDDVRVQLPYSRRELEAEEDYPIGNRIVRRYDEAQGPVENEDDGIVGLSYQQRSIRGNVPYNGEVWGTDSSIDCWADSPLLIKRGRMRELVRTLFVIGLSFTLVTFVIMGFKVYNMLITTLFLFFLISTISLLIFLLMKKPSCFTCCKEALDIPRNAEEGINGHQQGINAFLSDTQVVVLKKRISDSPPPYESPPDYNSLSPELIVNARGLSRNESSSDNLLNVTRAEEYSLKLSPNRDNNTRHSARPNLLRAFAVVSPSSILSSATPLLSCSFKPISSNSSPHSPSASDLEKINEDPGIYDFSEQTSHRSKPPPPPRYECLNEKEQSRDVV